MNRRLFLGAAAATASHVLSGSEVFAAQATKPKKILVLGGTNFVGPAIVERALSLGHEVTLFNRGITRPDLFPGVEKLRGDRRMGSTGLKALGGSRTWDAVIDVWPGEEALVRKSAIHLADRVAYYYFVSSIAVYRSFSDPWVAESAELRLDEEGYGGEKARAEAAVESLYPNRFGIARCPSIFGPRDPGSTLHYWLRNLQQRSEVLAPGSGKDPIQFVDVRDVGHWIVDCVQNQLAGVFNVTAPPLTFAKFLDACRAATQSSAKLTWLSKDYLYSQDVEAFTELPLWVPVEEDPGFFQISSDKASRRGLGTRPADQTIAAAWRWYQSTFFDGITFPHNGWGLSYERQANLIAGWRASQDP